MCFQVPSTSLKFILALCMVLYLLKVYFFPPHFFSQSLNPITKIVPKKRVAPNVLQMAKRNIRALAIEKKIMIYVCFQKYVHIYFYSNI